LGLYEFDREIVNFYNIFVNDLESWNEGGNVSTLFSSIISIYYFYRIYYDKK